MRLRQPDGRKKKSLFFYIFVFRLWISESMEHSHKALLHFEETVRGPMSEVP